MMIADFKSAGGIQPDRSGTNTRSTRLFNPKHSHPALGTSVRLPVTRENRLHLRALRNAELRAWNGASRTNANARLRADVARAASEDKREFRLFASIVVTTAVAVALGVLASIRFVEEHDQFVALVKQLLGMS
jgi:hypothetical protein